jgi:hypothetical protein
MFKKFKDNIQGPSYAGKYREVIGRIPYSNGKFFIVKNKNFITSY